jgi:hypothetical protein
MKMTKKAALASLAAIALAATVVTPTYARRGDDDDGADERRDRGRHASSTAATADLGCLSDAVAAREDALMEALDGFAGDAKAALAERKDDLADAYSLDERKEVKAAVKDAWATYRGAVKSARAELKSDKKAAYAEFKKDAKACGAGGAEATDLKAPGDELLL